jgi:hypothetical protein
MKKLVLASVIAAGIVATSAPAHAQFFNISFGGGYGYPAYGYAYPYPVYHFPVYAYPPPVYYPPPVFRYYRYHTYYPGWYGGFHYF